MTVRSRHLASALLVISLIGWTALIATHADSWTSLRSFAIAALVVLSIAVIAMYAVDTVREHISRCLEDFFLASTSDREDPTSELLTHAMPLLPMPRAVASAPIPTGTLVMSPTQADRRSNGRRRSRTVPRVQANEARTRRRRKGSPAPQQRAVDQGQPDRIYPWSAYLAGRADEASDGSMD